VRITKILTLGLMSACLVATSAQAGSRDRNPKNGDELIGYVNDSAGSGTEIMGGVASMAANVLGVRIPGLATQSARGYQPHQQNYGDYQRDPGAPAYDFYADCRYGSSGKIEPRCARRVNNTLSQAAREQGETFICRDRYGNLVRTQDFNYGCRLESNMTSY
jgi:hypothetical protein